MQPGQYPLVRNHILTYPQHMLSNKWHLTFRVCFSVWGCEGVCMSVSVSVCLWVRLSVCECVCLSVSVSVCECVCHCCRSSSSIWRPLYSVTGLQSFHGLLHLSLGQKGSRLIDEEPRSHRGPIKSVINTSPFPPLVSHCQRQKSSPLKFFNQLGKTCQIMSKQQNVHLSTEKYKLPTNVFMVSQLLGQSIHYTIMLAQLKAVE